MPKTESALRLLTLPVLAVLLTACSAAPKSSLPSAPIPSATVPPLPLEARQPKTPELCSPTCSEGLRKRLESLLP
jgi:hypothetical protein